MILDQIIRMDYRQKPVDIELAITILAIKKIAEAHFAGGASP